MIREDPVQADVLYVGTDRGAYVSLDRGTTWQGLPGGLPNVPVHDLIVHPRERELVAATHGRSMYVLDALPIQELTETVRAESVHVFPVEDLAFNRFWRGRRSPWFDNRLDEPFINVPFWTAQDGAAELIVQDEDGRPLQRLELEATRGVNTFTWDLLLDEESALAAEKTRLDEASDDEADDKSKKKKRRKNKDPEPEDDAKVSTEGRRAKTPWAEAVRLERQLIVTPGSYTLVVRVADSEAETDFEVTPAEPRTPRMKKEPKIRGRKGD